MAEGPGVRAAGLLVDQGWEAIHGDRFREAISAASRAIESAVHLDDPVLLIRALSVEAAALYLMGDSAAARLRQRLIELTEASV